MTNNPLFRIVAQLDDHFRADDCSPADADCWKELKGRIARMAGALFLIEITLRDGYTPGMPITSETARKLERHVRLREWKPLTYSEARPISIPPHAARRPRPEPTTKESQARHARVAGGHDRVLWPRR